MELSVDRSGVWTVMTARGEIDLHNSTDLRTGSIRALDEGGKLLLDLSGVTYIDSSGVAALAQALSHARNNDGELALVGTSEAVLRILHLTKLDRVFTMYDAVTEAPGA